MSSNTPNPNVPDAEPPILYTTDSTPSLATLAIHADDSINHYTDVAPAIHVSTTFRYTSDPSKLVPEHDLDLRSPDTPAAGDSHIYSRATAPNTSRLEAVLSNIIGQPSLTYSSGLAAFHALLVHLHPKVVAIGDGYHGCHGVLEVYKKLTNCVIVDLFDESTWDGPNHKLGSGDVVHLETPVNPHGKAYDIAHFAQRAHARGAKLTVDATFAPPPLLDPFKWGADYVMHSGTKYFGGHSDMLCGVLAIARSNADWEKAYWSMWTERMFLGSVMGSLEGWLGVRSLRTLELRVKRQSGNADKLVAWIDGCLKGSTDAPKAEVEAVQKTVTSITHASLQTEDFPWLKEQMPNGFGPVFSFSLKSEIMAKSVPSKLHFFHHATSLGGVESLIEWRRMSDDTVGPELLRVSVGVENWEDLKYDLLQGLQAVASL